MGSEMCIRDSTYDDLIDFHLLLTDRGWFEDLLEAHRRRH